MVTSGAMTARLDRLEKAGLTRRAPHPSDRRGVVVELTAKGRELTDEALTAHVANEHEILAGLTHEDREMLAKLLKKLIGSLRSPS
jgi:DNA-binding MarR family transcriptional regulator